MATHSSNTAFTAIAWCLAWGDRLEPRPEFQVLREALKKGQVNPAKLSNEAQDILTLVRSLQSIVPAKDATALQNYPRTLDALQDQYRELYNEKTAIGLVLGGATKIKQYVFEAADLQDIRGASALLDRINLVDLKAFFDPNIASTVRPWFEQTFPDLAKALIPELIIYSTGGNILAFCPAAYIHQLSDAIEQCYTRETLTANSAAVGNTFNLLELRFGRLRHPWLQAYLDDPETPILKAYFDQSRSKDALPLTETDYIQQFSDRKSFSELVTHLATRFNQRRSGNILSGRSQTRACPPMFETHAYLSRDESGHRSSTVRISELPDNPRFSEASARKYIMGQQAKRTGNQDWWERAIGNWQPGEIESWVQRFLAAFPQKDYEHYIEPLKGFPLKDVKEARSLREIGAASHPEGFVAYIYADGNNMGGYIQKAIKTPEAYQQFSDDVFHATEYAVYRAIARHLQPIRYRPDARSSRGNKDAPVWIHPFEILTIGGDDVLLIVPADKGLDVAKTLSEAFEQELLHRNPAYQAAQHYDPDQIHRYRAPDPRLRPTGREQQCQLSMSAGVLITAENTPIYYADRLVGQLLKSAKRKAKALKKEKYLGGTIDFLVLKSVTMISSNVDEFRAQGLTRDRPGQPTIKLYSAPYTLHEIGGLLQTVKALHNSKFPRSQIYQIRSLLEQGKKTAMLNYSYFRARLKQGDVLDTSFRDAWCWAQSNDGTLAPWRYVSDRTDVDDRTYETIWRELVDLSAFVPEADASRPNRSTLSPRREATSRSQRQ
ncbi:MAG: type III-B CRISPR-associated protein Cas10/Cmr2 [Stenomitos frigidus ULC029]